MKLICLFVLLIVGSPTVNAASFSFTGMFTQDDNVQLFTFAVGSVSAVTLQSLSYAGGVNAAGATIARGGFDPILALFDSTGLLLAQNDDGPTAPVDLSGQAYDTMLTATLNPGTYTVSVMEYDNFANGPNLSDGFFRTGQGNFTGSAAFDLACANVPQFCDVSGNVQYNARNGHWAFDILNVGEAAEVGSPEPASILLMSGAVVAMSLARRRTRLN